MAGRIESLRRKASRWKNHFVDRRIVIGVDRRHRHAPFGFVYRLAGPIRNALPFECVSAEHVGSKGALDDLKLAVITPVIGITNFLVHLCELRESKATRGI